MGIVNFQCVRASLKAFLLMFCLFGEDGSAMEGSCLALLGTSPEELVVSHSLQLWEMVSAAGAGSCDGEDRMVVVEKRYQETVYW